MCRHLADRKDEKPEDENPCVHRNSQDGHAHSSEGDAKDHGGKGFGVFHKTRNEQLQGDDGACVDHRNMFGLELPIAFDAQQCQEAIHGGVHRRHVHIVGHIPQHGVEHLEIENPKHGVDHNHAHKAKIFQHHHHTAQHLNEAFAAGGPFWFFIHKDVENQQPSGANGSHNKDVGPRNAFEIGDEDERKDECAQVDAPVKDSETETAVAFVGFTRDSAGNHRFKKSGTDSHEQQTEKNQRVAA